MRSSVEIHNIKTGLTRVVWQTDQLVEAPNFARDGKSLAINGDGRLHRLPLDGRPPVPIDTGFAVRCNNDHGLSPDGRWLAICDKTEFGKSAIYILPAEGGMPRLVTPNLPSYWHGWSPDGKSVCYCGIRGDLFDIYTIPIEGGEERRLTFGEGKNDGPDWSADGRIYFNSSRSGRMQIWSVRPDGGVAARVTDSPWEDWFPHPSPSGRYLLVLSFDAGVFDHPRDQHVRLRLMDADGRNDRVLFDLFGGQGTMNVPNWSPDGDEFAFVRYESAG
ncbi:TolB family protein [Rhizobium sp. ARZ01]|uniref:TolB family protein n=1 Tax=Rhizobium sp. ARZ01 TaxID=2769313 RepID=UPI001784DE06|nr:PD40 domain-containing protein [Rhizobium sp. ARZ01]MBD9372602.1 TolB family protein [Rhizobium sp. ARZ01]